MMGSKRHNWNMADTITAVRMVASLFMLFLPLKSIWFLVIYTFAGLTDVLDGWLARKSGRASEFGARLDSIADLLFYSILLIRLFPVLYQILPREIWYAVSGIVLVRLAAYVTAAVKYHRFVSLHTWLNKLTGVAVFLLPYVLFVSYIVVYSWAICILAFVASVEELAIHLLRAGILATRKWSVKEEKVDDATEQNTNTIIGSIFILISLLGIGSTLNHILNTGESLIQPICITLFGAVAAWMSFKK